MAFSSTWQQAGGVSSQQSIEMVESGPKLSMYEGKQWEMGLARGFMGLEFLKEP